MTAISAKLNHFQSSVGFIACLPLGSLTTRLGHVVRVAQRLQIRQVMAAVSGVAAPHTWVPVVDFQSHPDAAPWSHTPPVISLERELARHRPVVLLPVEAFTPLAAPAGLSAPQWRPTAVAPLGSQLVRQQGAGSHREPGKKRR